MLNYLISLFFLSVWKCWIRDNILLDPFDRVHKIWTSCWIVFLQCINSINCSLYCLLSVLSMKVTSEYTVFNTAVRRSCISKLSCVGSCLSLTLTCSFPWNNCGLYPQGKVRSRLVSTLKDTFKFYRAEIKRHHFNINTPS